MFSRYLFYKARNTTDVSPKTATDPHSMRELVLGYLDHDCDWCSRLLKHVETHQTAAVEAKLGKVLNFGLDGVNGSCFRRSDCVLFLSPQ